MNPGKLSFSKLLIGMSLGLAVNSVAFAEERKTGVLGLYAADTQRPSILDESKISDLGCLITLKGGIGEAKGDIGLEQPNQFVLLICENPVLGEVGKRRVLNGLMSSGKALALLEGDHRYFPDANRVGAVADRQYILKISHYNNHDVDGRDRDLDRLNREAGAIAGTYMTDSFLAVNRATGLPTPDEVVVIYYDNAEAGDRFRDNNPEILQKIGKFNKTHLVDTVYYVGRVMP